MFIKDIDPLYELIIKKFPSCNIYSNVICYGQNIYSIPVFDIFFMLESKCYYISKINTLLSKQDFERYLKLSTFW